VVFEPELQVATDFRGVAIGPGTFDQSPTGMGSAGFGNGTLPAALATGVFRGDQPQEFPEFPGMIEARQVAKFRHGRDRPGRRNPSTNERVAPRVPRGGSWA
jgi:hypothetical protein